mgnify:CR=1 FL=1
MRQKTFKITETTIEENWSDLNFRKGEEVILFCRTNEMTGKEYWCAYKLSEYPDGIGGNMNPKIKAFHGWRGTTNNISFHAYGVRKIEKIITSKIYDKNGIFLENEYKITVGKDIHPEWE